MWQQEKNLGLCTEVQGHAPSENFENIVLGLAEIAFLDISTLH